MARKRGEYQRRKERENILTTIFCVCCWLLIAFALLWSIIESAVTVKQINEDTLNVYTGGYCYDMRRGAGRNGSLHYEFILENGDILTIPRRLCSNKELIDGCEYLTFQYSNMTTLSLFRKTYTAIAIETVDGTAIVRDIEHSYSRSVGIIWSCSVLLLLWLGIGGFVLLLWYHVGKWDKRFQKWSKKRIKMREQIDSSK